MDLIRIDRKNNCDVVDSRLIAMELGIQHKNFYQTIKDNQTDIEEAFGRVLLETETLNTAGGMQQVKFAYNNFAKSPLALAVGCIATPFRVSAIFPQN